jgi:hypothetical protein
MNKDDSDTKQWGSQGRKLDLYNGRFKVLLIQDKKAKTLENKKGYGEEDWLPNSIKITRHSK